MKKKRASSDFQQALGEGSVLARRKATFSPNGSYLFEDALEVKGDLLATVITCTAWLVELYELRAGEVSFMSGAGHVRPGTNSFGVFYPPFTISQPCLKDAKGRLAGLAGTESLPSQMPTVPTIFELTRKFSRLMQVTEILTLGQHWQPIDFNPRPSLLSLRAKRLIDENYLLYPSIARIATRLAVTHEHLSRQFKRDFGLSPSTYLHQLRLADAPLRLAKGEEIVNVSLDVGYNDLSRFYKQFRKATKTSPGFCRGVMKPGHD